MKRTLLILALLCFSFNLSIAQAPEISTKNLKIRQLCEEGDIKLNQGNYEEAIADYRDALKLYNTKTPSEVYIYDHEIHKALAQSYLFMEKYREALKQIDLAIKNLPDRDKESLFYRAEERSGYWELRAEINWLLEDPEAAIADLSTGLNIFEKPDLYVARSRLYATRGKMDEALADMNKAVELKPDYANLVQRAAIYLQLEKFPEGMADAEKAINLEPGEPTAYLYRGLARANSGDFQQALADMEQLIALAPDTAEGYFYRGLLYAGNLNEIEKGCRDLTKAKEMGYAPAKEASEHYCN